MHLCRIKQKQLQIQCFLACFSWESKTRHHEHCQGSPVCRNGCCWPQWCHARSELSLEAAQPLMLLGVSSQHCQALLTLQLLCKGEYFWHSRSWPEKVSLLSSKHSDVSSRCSQDFLFLAQKNPLLMLVNRVIIIEGSHCVYFLKYIFIHWDVYTQTWMCLPTLPLQDESPLQVLMR